MASRRTTTTASRAARSTCDVAEAIEALPGLARIAATTWLRTARVGRVASALAGDPRGCAAADPQTRELAAGAGPRARDDRGRRPAQLGSCGRATPSRRRCRRVGVTWRPAPEPTPEQPARGARTRVLRERGEELLDRSRDVWNDEQAHPAYARILDDLAPDEGRILLLLLRAGPQPSVDVRTGGPVGLVQLAAGRPGLTMIGARAGCRYLDQVPSYLDNLFRLGLVWFSREHAARPGAVPGARGAARRARGDALGAVAAGGAPQHPPHAVRRRTSAAPCWRRTPTPPSTRRTRYRWAMWTGTGKFPRVEWNGLNSGRVGLHDVAAVAAP